MSSIVQSNSKEDFSTFKNFINSYIVQQLKKYGYKKYAEKIAVNLEPPTELSYKLVQKISNQLAEEKKEQLEEICYEMQITSNELQDTFETISKEMFYDNIMWGRIVTFIAFTGALSVYCVQNQLAEQVPNIMEWAESFVQANLIQWIINNGGWTAFVKHFSDQEINMSAYVPQFLLGMGITALTLTGGILAFKRKLFTL